MDVPFDHTAFRIEADRDATPLQATLGALARAAAAAERYFGPQARSRWQLVSVLCSGRLLANTSSPLSAPGVG